jgi:hypothetical protein
MLQVILLFHLPQSTMPFVDETSESQKPFVAGCSVSGAHLRRERRNVRRKQARARNPAVEATPGSSCKCDDVVLPALSY